MLEKLQEIRNLYAHHNEIEAGNYFSSYIKKQLQEKIIKEDMDVLDSVSDKEMLPERLGLLLERLNGLVDSVEEIEIDSKLDALIEYLNATVNEKGFTHVCVWTSYAATAEYLWATLGDAFATVYMVTGATSPEEKIQAVSGFEKNGGILILTDASSEGVELTFADQCINYDLTKRDLVMEIRWSRFDRLGRKKPFKMLALLDDNKIFGELES